MFSSDFSCLLNFTLSPIIFSDFCSDSSTSSYYSNSNSSTQSDSSSLHGKPYFLFPDVLKRWSFQKNCAGIWSFLYYRERPCFFFPKIRSDTLDGQWKMIFLKKKIHGNMTFSSNFLKRRSFQKGPRRDMIFLVLSGKMVFFPENMILFPWAESERRPFSGNTWKHDASPSEKKQETWYIGSKFGLSLNLFGWRYSTMNNLQYFVPFSSGRVYGERQ